ncbi:MAG TPA: NUDIX hydrolase [Bryobacteraceae bacterium]|jgi:ADP-ribose pyrophosphatase YjhB (NUDIX family)
MRRRYPKHPLVGVGALIFTRAGRRGPILLVERAGKPLKGYWSLPGGLVETGELLEDAVRREILEETGLRVEPVRFYDFFERIMRDADGRAEYHYLLADYICKVVGGELRPATDASRAAWVRRSELDQYKITEGTRAVIEKVYSDVRRTRS